jgi:hypothetical protein
MYSDTLLTDAFRAWRQDPGPRLLVLETPPGLEVRRRLAAIAGRERASIDWVRPPPGGGEPAPATWSATWRGLLERAGRGDGGVWIVDDAHRLPQAAWEGLLDTWIAVRGQALPVHLALVGLAGLSERLGEIPHARMRMEPLPSATWLGVGTTWSPASRVRAAAIFGRSAALRGAVDPSRSVGRNARSLFLAPDAPYAMRPLDVVRLGVQRPERYFRVVQALAEGSRDWGDVRSAVGGLSGSGQLGPYMKTLEELGIVVGDRSLDAGPRSRSRRWRLVDPHIAFWYACVLPTWDRLGIDDAKRLWSAAVQPRLEPHVGRTLPLLVREWLESAGAVDVLGSSARETGGLWGEGYDIDVAATLRNGAIVYAWTRWERGSFTPEEVEARLDQVRTTRYGFGRERRLKLFVQRDPPDHELTRLDARDPELLITDIGRLTGARHGERAGGLQ